MHKKGGAAIPLEAYQISGHAVKRAACSGLQFRLYGGIGWAKSSTPDVARHKVDNVSEWRVDALVRKMVQSWVVYRTPSVSTLNPL